MSVVSTCWGRFYFIMFRVVRRMFSQFLVICAVVVFDGGFVGAGEFVDEGEGVLQVWLLG